MKNILFTLLLITFSFSANAQEVFNPEGFWLTENKRSVIEVQKATNGKIYGKIAWIIEGGMQYDSKNPDATKHKKPMCGLRIMSALKQSPFNPNKWQGGTIYKADDGDIYDVFAELQSADKMKIRGFKGISLLGKTQYWTRTSQSDYPQCKPAK